MTAGFPRFVERDLAALFALACIALGGASAAGLVANAVLQIVAITVIATVLFARCLPPLPPGAVAGLRLIALAAALMLAQLIPLPPAIWQRLPGRNEVAAALTRMDAGTPWLPVSLAPDATVAALLSLLVPLAAMLAMLAATRRGRQRAMFAVVAAALASLAIGFAQRIAGADSGLYLYQITNRGSAVGLFANRNHLATLLLCALPLATSLGHRWSATTEGPARLGRYIVTGALVAVLAIGVIAVGSVAGWAMLGPVLAASAMPFGARRILPIVAAGLVVASLATITLHGRTIDPDPQHRPTLTANTVRAAAAYLPFGAGGGSFVSIYPRQEDPLGVTPEYTNHAHNDYAEVLLDYGIPGVVLIGAAFLWLGKELRRLRHITKGTGDAAAGCIVLAILIVHSSVDYPLRTAAMAMLAGLASACISASPATSQRVFARVQNAYPSDERLGNTPP